MSLKEKAFLLWSVIAIILAIICSILLNASFPLFTIIWIGVAILVVLRKKDAGAVGFSKVPLMEFIKVTLLNLGITAAIFTIVEPLTHTYEMLLKFAADSTTPDVTFAWLIRLQGNVSWIGLFLFSGLISMFGEELFFRGFLLQLLKKHMKPALAVTIQAVLFILPNIIIVFFMPFLQGAVYTIAYTGLAIGITGGWSANRTNSIWPGLITASITNLVIVFICF